MLKGRVVTRLIDIELEAIDVTEEEQLSLALEVTGIWQEIAALIY